MSDGNKKPGLRDISNLKARLGMLNTGSTPAAPGSPRPPAGPGNPFAPKAPAPPSGAPATPSAPPATPSAPPVVESAPAAPAMPATPVAPPPSGPAAPAGPPGLNLGADLFKKKAPPPAPTASQPAVDPSAFFDQPSRQVLDEAPKAEAEFANPLQVGAYANAAAPVDLNAEEEAALSSYEHKQRGVKPGLAIGMTVGVGLLTLLFGFFIGDARVSRKLINAQIDSSVRVQDRVQDVFSQYDQIKNVVMQMSKAEVDWAKIGALPKDIMEVDAGMLSSPVPLDKDLTQLLTRFLVETSAFFDAVKDHRQLTTGRDEAELKAMAEGSSFAQNKAFAVLYDPVDADARGPYIPPVGKIVAVTGKPKEEEVKEGRRTVTEYVLPIVNREGKESEVRLQRVLQIDKSEFITAGKANPMTLYSDRVEDLQRRVKNIEQYYEMLQQTLETQAEREKVFSL